MYISMDAYRFYIYLSYVSQDFLEPDVLMTSIERYIEYYKIVYFYFFSNKKYSFKEEIWNIRILLIKIYVSGGVVCFIVLYSVLF